MPSASDDREQLRQDHPGAAAHLPTDEVTLRSRVEQGIAGAVHVASEAAAAVDGVLAALCAGPVQDALGVPDAWRVTARDGDYVHMYVTADAEVAAMGRESGCLVEELVVRAPGAVAAAPEHDEATVERVAKVIADSVRPGWRIDFAAVARDALTAAYANPEETR